MGENGPLSSSSEPMMIFRGLQPRRFNYDCQPLYLIQIKLFHLVAQGIIGYAQQFGGFCLVAVGQLQGLADQVLFHFLKRQPFFRQDQPGGFAPFYKGLLPNSIGQSCRVIACSPPSTTKRSMMLRSSRILPGQ